MRIGIIAEFNPLHSGHKYIISRAREEINNNGGSGDIICVMSEFFTQRGEVAIIDGYKRAKEAVVSGCDLVIAMPYVASVSYSDDFAKRSIKMLVSFGITHLIFGTESNVERFEEIFNIQSQDSYKEEERRLLKQGYSYPKIMKEVLGFGADEPNFILAYGYYKAIRKYAPSIKLIPVERLGQGLNVNLVEESPHLSATSIRNNLNSDKISKYLSSDMLVELRGSVVSEEDFYDSLRYKILSLGKSGIAEIYDVSEGLENRIYECNLKAKSYAELIDLISTKRYSRKKIQRILMHILTDTTKDVYSNEEERRDFRVLAVNKERTSLIREINNMEEIRLHQKLKKDNENLFLHDIKVSRIYNLFYGGKDIFKYNIELVDVK